MEWTCDRVLHIEYENARYEVEVKLTCVEWEDDARGKGISVEKMDIITIDKIGIDGKLIPIYDKDDSFGAIPPELIKPIEEEIAWLDDLYPEIDDSYPD